MDGFVNGWFSSGLRQGRTEAAFLNFETPFLRDEVPLVNAETAPLQRECQNFSEKTREARTPWRLQRPYRRREMQAAGGSRTRTLYIRYKRSVPAGGRGRKSRKGKEIRKIFLKKLFRIKYNH